MAEANAIVNQFPYAIDICSINEMPFESFRTWLRTERSSWSTAVNNRISAFLTLPPNESIAAHQKTYCPDQAKNNALRIASGNQKLVSPLCGLVYVSTRYGVSCHELLFGTPRPVELFGRTRAFVTLVSSLENEAYKNRLKKHLTNCHLDTDSPLFVFRERCKEVGFSQSVPYRTIRAMVLGSTVQQAILEQLYAPGLSHRMEFQPDGVVTHAPGFDMVLVECRRYQVSADYLVLQDYSDFATINGEALSAEQKEWLTLYLCASPAGQVDAISMLTKQLLSNSKRHP